MSKRQYVMLIAAAVIAGLIGGTLSLTFLVPQPAVGQAASDEARTAITGKVVLLDERGSERAVLLVWPESKGAGLLLYDGQGAHRVDLGVTADGDAHLLFNDERGGIRALLSVAHREAIWFHLRDRGSNTRIQLELSDDGAPSLKLCDRAERVRAELSVRGDGEPNLVMYDRDGNTVWAARELKPRTKRETTRPLPVEWPCSIVVRAGDSWHVVTLERNGTLAHEATIELASGHLAFVEPPYLYVVTKEGDDEEEPGETPPHRLLRYDLSKPEDPQLDGTLALPHMPCESILVRDKVAMLGGNQLVVVNYKSDTPKPVAIGPKLSWPTKTFDALAISGSALYAIDNVVWPVCLFVYDIADPAKPVFKAKVDLGHAANTTTEAALAVGDYLVLLKERAGSHGQAQIIETLGLDDFAEVDGIAHSWSEPTPFEWSEEEEKAAKEWFESAWQQIVLFDGQILVAARNAGILPVSMEEGWLTRGEPDPTVAPCLGLVVREHILVAVGEKAVYSLERGDDGSLEKLDELELKEGCSSVH